MQFSFHFTSYYIEPSLNTNTMMTVKCHVGSKKRKKCRCNHNLRNDHSIKNATIVMNLIIFCKLIRSRRTVNQFVDYMNCNLSHYEQVRERKNIAYENIHTERKIQLWEERFSSSVLISSKKI